MDPAAAYFVSCRWIWMASHSSRDRGAARYVSDQISRSAPAFSYFHWATVLFRHRVREMGVYIMHSERSLGVAGVRLTETANS